MVSGAQPGDERHVARRPVAVMWPACGQHVVGEDGGLDVAAALHHYGDGVPRVQVRTPELS